MGPCASKLRWSWSRWRIDGERRCRLESRRFQRWLSLLFVVRGAAPSPFSIENTTRMAMRASPRETTDLAPRRHALAVGRPIKRIHLPSASASQATATNGRHVGLDRGGGRGRLVGGKPTSESALGVVFCCTPLHPSHRAVRVHGATPPSHPNPSPPSLPPSHTPSAPWGKWQ